VALDGSFYLGLEECHCCGLLVRVDVNVIQSPSLDEVEHEVERCYLLVEVALALASSRHGGPVVRLEHYSVRTDPVDRKLADDRFEFVGRSKYLYP